jgi:hypothetical protein
MRTKSLQGKIWEFVKKENIREKSGNFTRETKKYENFGWEYFIICLNFTRETNKFENLGCEYFSICLNYGKSFILQNSEIGTQMAPGHTK